MRLPFALKSALREPLLHFLLIGAALFAASRWLVPSAHIVVGPAQIEHERQVFRQQFGQDPDRAMLERLIEAWIRDEALYREAQRLGLAEGDEIVRRHLVEKMELLLRATPPPEPAATELEAYRAAHAERYSQPGLNAVDAAVRADWERDRRDAAFAEEVQRRIARYAVER